LYAKQNSCNALVLVERKHKTNYEVCWVRDQSVPNYCQPWIDIFITPPTIYSIFSSNNILINRTNVKESKVGNLFQILEAITGYKQKTQFFGFIQRLQFLRNLQLQTITIFFSNGLGTQNIDTYHLMRKFMTAIVNNKDEKNNYGSGLG